jgi:2-hydroxychromene-2-carboxylate isomerase
LQVDFWFGAGSRYSYLAATQLAAIQAETEAQFNWLPVNSARLIEAAQHHNPFATANGSGQYDWGYRQRDAEAWAEYYRVPFREPHGRIALDPDLLARACTAALRLKRIVAYAHALFAAIFVDDLAAVDRETCITLAGDVGLDRAIFTGLLDSADLAAEQHALLNKALGRGVFGVPTFIAGDRLFWGNDRLVLLRHYLRNTGNTPYGRAPE